VPLRQRQEVQEVLWRDDDAALMQDTEEATGA